MTWTSLFFLETFHFIGSVHTTLSRYEIIYSSVCYATGRAKSERPPFWFGNARCNGTLCVSGGFFDPTVSCLLGCLRFIRVAPEVG